MSFALPRTLRRLPTRLVAGATTAAVLALATGPVLADALEQVPADALAVVRLKSLAGLDGKVAKFANQVGLDQMAPEFATPLASFKQQIGATEGVNDEGDLAVALMAVDPADQQAARDAGGDDTPVMPVILVPVTDYQAFLANYPDGETDGDVTTVEMGENGDLAYVAKRGDYAAISPIQSMVAAAPTDAISFGGMAAEQLKDRDAVLLANMPRLREALAPALEEGRQKVMDEMDERLAAESSGNPDLEAFTPAIKAAVGQGLDVAEAFLRDGENAVIGLDLDDAGLHSVVLAEFKPDSYLGGVFGSLKGTTESLVKGLPAGDYLMFGGSALPRETLTKLIKDIAGPIVEEVKKVDDPKGQTVVGFYDSALKASGAVESSTVGLLAPSKMFGQSAILQQVQIARGDVATLKTATRELFEKQQEAMALFAPPEARMTVDYQENVETVAGVQFDAVTVEPAPGGDPQAVQQQQQLLGILYGPQGNRTLIGEAGGVLLSLTGLDDAAIETVVASVKEDKDNLTDMLGMDETVGELPDERLMAFYIPLDKWVSAGAKVAGPMMPVQVQVPANLPPIGSAISSEGASLKAETFVPTKLIQALVTTGMQAQQQMGGGGPNGGL